MNNSIRGPLFRKFWDIHCVSFDEDTAEYYQELMRRFVSTLPCGECQQHAVRFVQDNEPKFKSGKELSEYILRFKNSVNVRLGQEEQPKEDYFNYLHEIECALHAEVKPRGVESLQ